MQNIFFFIFVHLDPSYFQTSRLFYFLFISNDLNCQKNTTWIFANHLWTLITRATYKEFFGCSRTSLCRVWWFVFEFLTLFTLGGHNFLNSIMFFMISSVQDVPIEGIQVLFKHQKNRALPLDLAYPKCFNVWSSASLP